MGQSLVKNYIHIIFSTKNREPIIDEDIEKELFSYLAGICKNMECFPVKIGGHRDHVHILCLLSKKVTLIKLLESLKSHSSKWIKTKNEKYSHFYWQKGYGSFSVNPKEIDAAIQYISNQKHHHSITTFKDEYLRFLANYEIEFDEKYIWD